VSITEEAVAPARRAGAWWLLVAACALGLVLIGAGLAAWYFASRETRTTSYDVLGDLSGVKLDLGSSDVELDGGASSVEVRRVDHFAFGHPRKEERAVNAGKLTIVSRCPDQVVGSCKTSYRLSVPDNVPIQVTTTSGDVRLNGVRASVQVATGSGTISATSFCGFSLRAVSDSGGVSAVSECSADRLELRSRSGSVLAAVPTGRYVIDAQTDSGTRRVRGLTESDDAPFSVQALSTTGDVTVEGTS
jgi:hypothetical protein